MSENEKYIKLASQLIMFKEQVFLPNGLSEIARLLEKADKEKRQLRVKLGIDPTNPDLHLGHTVCLYLLKRFQDLGHLPVLIIGGFTAMVGDPSGRNESRPALTHEQVMENAKSYLNQVSKILDINKIEVQNNYDWLSKLTSTELLQLAHLITVNQLVGKEAFGSRIEQGEPLYLHEVLYPILQGYDSVAVRSDIEIGGIDQTYNVLFGRHVQKHFNQEPQLVILNPLLIGLDGSKKMSKSFNNYIALNDTPDEMFGKTMSIPDELMFNYFSLTSYTQDDANQFKLDIDKGKNPRDIKMLLACEIVSQFYGQGMAGNAKENFIKQFQKNEIPDSIEEFSLNEPLKVIDLMYLAQLVPSKSEAKRLIDHGGVKLKSVRVTDPNLLITKNDKDSVLQIGKRKFIKIV